MHLEKNKQNKRITKTVVGFFENSPTLLNVRDGTLKVTTSNFCRGISSTCIYNTHATRAMFSY